MRLIIAKNAGFCPGVNNAINKVIELSEKTGKKIYTFGPLIHNKDVIKNLTERGIKAIEDISEIKDKENSILVIRAHGIPPETEKKLKESGLNIVDATCPLVKNVHNVITKYIEKGYHTIILGDPDHAEVIGLRGYAGDKCYVINSKEEAEKLPLLEKANLVSQTTQEEDLFFEVVKIIRPKVKELVISNTICTPTKLRQKETVEFSKISDLVVVIGGKHSANTQRLYQICKKLSKETILVENESEITNETIKDKETIFVTAGASTPVWLIERVEKKIKDISQNETVLSKFLNFFVVSGIFTGFASFGLISLIYKSFKSEIDIPLAFALSLAIMGVHIINRSFEKENLEKDIKKIIFLKYGQIIKYISFLSILLSIAISFNMGITYPILISLFAVPGLLYVKLKSSLKIPMGKDIFVSLGWVYIISFIPAIASDKLNTKIFYLSLVFVLISSVIRNIMISLLQKHNDIIISHQSIIYYLNEKKVYLILNLLLSTLLLISLNYYKIKPSAVLLPIYYLILSSLIKRKNIPDIILSEFLIELPFIMLIFF
ncbi:MAG TPA: 4-hydroxy-3-methylbut-2-enyl diphosphate reductase [Elusimicrobiales bacterium]|nr:4-hydroxy-3-methylbut-2-enyl diphosphate reductase [Elusimicrobiales bacterium]HOL62079.1 4-hydroxy-3-methylbut-2-enyl diphosphate reductase [Elusimicrobiales bacterium]HPO94407.1 4-hydroxy-3-methylbut-2-enyl diphosphate reductase [Elusimicrobiales bacterium]